MKQVLVRLIIPFVILLICFSAIAVPPAYSRGGGGGGGGGCFSGETLIATTEGEKAIRELKIGDRVFSYDLANKRSQVGTVDAIDTLEAADYYLINKTTKVTATHPFYVLTKTGIVITKVEDLKTGDRLLKLDNSEIAIFSIEQINQPITVYNLIDVNPYHNFYADGFLVHNKGGAGGRGGSGGYYYTLSSNDKSDRAILLTPQILWGIVRALAILFLGFLTILSWRKIYNYLIYRRQKFTEDSELIDFITNLNPEFKNTYSLDYTSDGQIWNQVELEAEFSENLYSYFISKANLITKVNELFERYQKDWTHKNFTAIEEYTIGSFKAEQKKIYRQLWGDNLDIVYQYQISDIIPLKFEIRVGLRQFIVQINATMINFQLSPTGYIVSGISEERSFTEYWNVGFDEDNRTYLINIYQSDRSTTY